MQPKRKKWRKTAHTSTEREREEPWGEGRQEKAGSTAPDCRDWWSGEVGDDSTFGIPYIWFNWPTVTYSFPKGTTHTHTHTGEEGRGEGKDRQEWRHKRQQDRQQEGNVSSTLSDLLHHEGVRGGGSERKHWLLYNTQHRATQLTPSTLGFDWYMEPTLASYHIMHPTGCH